MFLHHRRKTHGMLFALSLAMLRRMHSNIVALLFGLAIFPMALAARAETPEPTKKSSEVAVTDGVLFGARLAIAPAIDAHFSSAALSIGYKERWAIFTVDFGYEYVRSTKTYRDSIHTLEFDSTTETTDHRFLLSARSQVAFYRSSSDRLELFGQLGLGFVIVDSFGNSLDWGRNTTDPRFRDFGIAPGLRYWLHPHCAMSLTTGFIIAAVYENERSTTPTSTIEASPNFEFQFLTAF